jgi:hypothetical protein
MNRTTVATLVSAGVVGLILGTVSAVVREEPKAEVPAPLATASETPSPQRSTLLYADAKVIHDGVDEIPHDATEGDLRRLVRTKDGYLLANATSPQEPSFRLYAVAKDGTTTTVADVLGSWDLDESGTKVVGTDLESAGLFVWDLTGRVLETSGRPRGATLDPVWQGDRVVLSGRTEEDGGALWRVLTWEPSTGAMELTDHVGMTDWTGSADGELLAGSVGSDGVSTDESNPCLRVMTPPRGSGGDEWQTCDWRLNGPIAAGAFSPDGERLMAIPAQSDGFGPGVFMVMSATEGPRSGGVSEIDAPDWTLDAQWLDDDHLLVHSRVSDAENAGGVLTKCDLEGSCEEVARARRGDLVPGEQY